MKDTAILENSTIDEIIKAIQAMPARGGWQGAVRFEYIDREAILKTIDNFRKPPHTDKDEK